MKRCSLCDGEVTMKTAYVERTGWTKPRSKGGTNALVDATETGRIACPTCITAIQNGVAPGQVSLLDQEKPTKAMRDEVWDALTEVFGKAETETARTLRGKVVRSLVNAGATRETVMERVLAWPHFFEGATLTELALEKHWGQLATAPRHAAPLVDARGNVTPAGMRARVDEIKRQEETGVLTGEGGVNESSPARRSADVASTDAERMSASTSPPAVSAPDDWPEPDEIPLEAWPS